jgi:hypothetical protein
VEPIHEYAQFIAALPVRLEPDLATGDTGSTAFFSARRKGWSTDQLAADALATVARGGGVGLIISRLRTLATSQPAVRVTGPTTRWVSVEPDRAVPEWVRERRMLLTRIGNTRPDPDDAEQWMRDLVTEQKARA